MLSDVLSGLLSRAAETLTAEVAPFVRDDYARWQLNAVALFIIEIAAMWPDLANLISRQEQLYLSALGAGSAGDSEQAAIAQTGQQHRAIVQGVAAAFKALHEAEHPDRSALAALRAAVLEAAELEQALIAEGRVRSGTDSAKHI
jgi:hypothetical protein